jgi:hypothetical protein
MLPNLDSINEMFIKMESNGWNTSEPLKWGFFFFSQHKSSLSQIFSELAEYDYQIENIHQNDGVSWVMQVSKVETLLPEKLFKSCVAFNELASAYNSDYDGWDSGQNV